MGAVFCLFASFGFILGGVSLDHRNVTANICFALVSGLCSALWALAGTRKLYKAMVVLGIFQGGAYVLLSIFFDTGRTISALEFGSAKQYALFNAVTAIILIVAAYMLFLISSPLRPGGITRP